MRHAKSAEKRPNQPDKERDLTSDGVKETLKMAAFLNKKNISPDIIYTSTATRAADTARYLSDALRVDIEKVVKEEELYNASVRTFLEFINNIDDQYNNVLCVGHNPAISYLAEYLTKAETGEMPAGGVVSLKFTGNWKDINKGTGELLEFTTPQMLAQD